jgi:hypothetical protein
VKKRILSFVLVLSLILALVPMAMAAPNIDTASSWARAGITAAVAKGFVPSDLQGNYTEAITRAEFCRLAIKWLEYDTGKTIEALLTEKGAAPNPDAFEDTKDKDILAAFALGIINGARAPANGNPGLFNPNGLLDREQAATLIRNVCEAAGMDVSNITSAGFTDIGSASGWAVNGINFVRNNGIMSGTNTNPLTFSPKIAYTREQSIITFNNIKTGEAAPAPEPPPTASESAYDIYVRANAATQNINSFEMDMDIDMTVEADGDTMDMKIASNIRQVTRSETDVDMAMTMKMSMMDMDVNIRAFYRNGMYYLDSMGEKVKMPMPASEVTSQPNSEAIDFPEHAVKNMKTTNVEGGVEVIFTLDSAYFTDELIRQMGSVEDAFGNNVVYSFGDVTLKAVIGSNNLLRSVRMEFSFSMEMLGEKAYADYVVNVRYIRLGGVTVNFPSDLDTYVLVS